LPGVVAYRSALDGADQAVPPPAVAGASGGEVAVQFREDGDRLPLIEILLALDVLLAFHHHPPGAVRAQCHCHPK